MNRLCHNLHFVLPIGLVWLYGEVIGWLPSGYIDRIPLELLANFKFRSIMSSHKPYQYKPLPNIRTHIRLLVLKLNSSDLVGLFQVYSTSLAPP